MRPVKTSQTGVGDSLPVRLDYRQNSFKVGVSCVLNGTAANYTLQHTMDDPADFNGQVDYNLNANWFDSNDPLLVGASTDKDTNYAYPIQSSRVRVNSGSGTVTITYLQGS